MKWPTWEMAVVVAVASALVAAGAGRGRPTRFRAALVPAARELARVLRPAGRLLLRSGFSDHMPRIWWLEHFPSGFEVDASLFQPPHEVIATFTSAGWLVASFGTVTEPSSDYPNDQSSARGL